MKELKEFKPALLFLAKFLAIYFTSNVIYGIFIESSQESPDPITIETTRQTSWLLNRLGQNTGVSHRPETPLVTLQNEGIGVINVYEGCNGINVMIIFVAFLFAYGGPGRFFVWFLPTGLALIHLINLVRIALLYFTAVHRPDHFYYFHKFFFTGILYVAVFCLWALWVFKFQEKETVQTIA